jgi:hypothetical protein
MNNDAHSMMVPPDFPRAAEVASLPGVQPKIAVIRDAASGKYVAHNDSAETEARFMVCEDLAEQLAQKCRCNREGKYSHLSENKILTQVHNKLLASGWGTDAEMNWTTLRTAEKLGWDWVAGAAP